MTIKVILHLPHSFPTLHVHLLFKQGGLGVISVCEIRAEIQYKSFALLRRMNNALVDALLPEALKEHISKLGGFLNVRAQVSSRKDVNSVVL